MKVFQITKAKIIVITTAYLLLVASFFYLKDNTENFSHSQLQILIFPFFIAGLLFIEFLRFKISRWLLLSSLIIFGFFYYCANYLKIFQYSTGIVRLKGDLYENFTRVLTKDLRFKIKQYGNYSIGQISTHFENWEEINSFINQSSYQNIIWGSEDWINISTPISISSINDYKLFANYNYPISFIKTLPVVGFYYEPQKLTKEYLVRLISAFNDYEKQELYLKSSAKFSPLWAQTTHLAYSWFLLGNFYLDELLSKDYFDARLYKCVYDSYFKAMSSFESRFHPELSIALNNNIGVMHFVRHFFVFKDFDLRKAKKRFFDASRRLKSRNPYRLTYFSPIIAKQNLLLLKSRQVIKIKKVKNKTRKKKKNAQQRRNKSTT